MSDAFRCDRCGGFSEEDRCKIEYTEPAGFATSVSATSSTGEKDLCGSCYHGLIEYLSGTEASKVNDWDFIGCNDDEEDFDDE